MLITHDYVSNHSLGIYSFTLQFGSKMESMDRRWDGRNLLTYFELPLIDQVSFYFEKEWEIYEII